VEDTLLNHLRRMTLRPSMYLHPVTYATAISYLNGLGDGLQHAGFRHTYDDFREAAEARGWDCRGSTGIRRDFGRKGLKDEEQAVELIAIAADAYARAFARRVPANPGT
jgi:hypothetical protein